MQKTEIGTISLEMTPGQFAIVTGAVGALTIVMNNIPDNLDALEKLNHGHDLLLVLANMMHASKPEDMNQVIANIGKIIDGLSTQQKYL